MSSTRILIVEDEMFVAADLEVIVQAQIPSAQIVLCASLSEAERAAQEPVGLALLDIDVVGGKSFGVAERLKASGTPIAFVSASRKEELPPALAEVPFITKPFTARSVVAFVQRAIGSN